MTSNLDSHSITLISFFLLWLLDSFWIFLGLSWFFFLFLFLVSLGIWLDPRFEIKYKALILLLLSYIFIFFLYSFHEFRGNNIYWLWLIKDIFWFTLLLNISFIFHICILDWIYQFFRYYEKDFLAFLITRLSFIFSLFLPYYLLELFQTHYFSRNKFLRLVSSLVLWILVYFMNLFNSYCLFLMTSKKIKYSWKSILILLVSFIISYFILGIARLYFFWIYLSLISLGEVFLVSYRKGLKEAHPWNYILSNYDAEVF